MHSFSFGEIALVFGIVVILFGGSRLASIGKSLGEGISNFKKGLNAEEPSKNKDAANHLNQNPVSYTPPQVPAHHNLTSEKASHSQIIDVEQKESR